MQTSSSIRAVVTGGAGFIGSHVVDAYVERGWEVTVIDDLSTGSKRNVNPRARLVEADLRDPSTATTIAALRPDVVSHHAAQVNVRRSVSDPELDAEINVVASIRLMRVCAEARVQRFVFASTGGAIYGEPLGGPQEESHPERPLSPYGCAKLSVEHYLHYFREAFGLPGVALRYANVYGPRQDARGEAGVVAIFCERALRGEPLVVNGTGEQTRDFVFVQDVVRANLALTDELSLKGPYNVGTGIETSVNALARGLLLAAGVQVPIVHDDAKAGEQLRSVLDGTRLRTAARLREPVPLQEGLAATVDWFRSRTGLEEGTEA